MTHQHSIVITWGLAGLLAAAAPAQAQNFEATKVLESQTSSTSGGSVLTTPVALNDNDVVFASTATVNMMAPPYYTSYPTVWDNGVQPAAAYLLYPFSSKVTNLSSIVAASNAGAFPGQPGGGFVGPAVNGWLYGGAVSNSGRMLVSVDVANGANGTTSNFYASNVGGSQWTQVKNTLDTNVLKGVGINNNGTVVGQATDAAGLTHAFYTNSDGTLKYVDLGGASSSMSDINDVGVAVGVMTLNSDGRQHVFTVDTLSGAVRDLGVDPSTSAKNLALNDAGQVVRGTSLYDPQSSTWTQVSANGLVSDYLHSWSLVDINNKGNLLTLNDTLGIYVLHAVPEPSTHALMGLGLLGLGLAARRKAQAMAQAPV